MAYTNDLLFARGDVPSIKRLISYLEQFANMASLHINLMESSIHMVGIDDKPEIASYHWLAFRRALSLQIFGIPLTSEKLRVVHYNLLIDSIIHRVHSWPRHTISYVGKLQFITLVLQGVEYFWLPTLSMLYTVINKIHTICYSLMWTTKHLLIC